MIKKRIEQVQSMINKVESAKANSKQPPIKRIHALIEKEYHEAHKKHNRSVHIYVILFSISLFVLTSVYVYNPNLPFYVILINILIAIVIFASGIIFLTAGYKREIADYLTIEEKIDNLKK